MFRRVLLVTSTLKRRNIWMDKELFWARLLKHRGIKVLGGAFLCCKLTTADRGLLHHLSPKGNLIHNCRVE